MIINRQRIICFALVVVLIITAIIGVSLIWSLAEIASLKNQINMQKVEIALLNAEIIICKSSPTNHPPQRYFFAETPF